MDNGSDDHVEEEHHSQDEEDDGGDGSDGDTEEDARSLAESEEEGQVDDEENENQASDDEGENEADSNDEEETWRLSSGGDRGVNDHEDLDGSHSRASYQPTVFGSTGYTSRRFSDEDGSDIEK